MIDRRIVALLLLPALLTGCRSARSFLTQDDAERRPLSRTEARAESATTAAQRERSAAATDEATQVSSGIVTASSSTETQSAEKMPTESEGQSEGKPPVEAGRVEIKPLQLNHVVQSIYASYPLLQVAVYGRNVVAGEQLSAEGAWDLKLKADANNAPLGYYKTYRNGVGFEQPTMWEIGRAHV